MNESEKIKSLKEIIELKIKPLINRDYWLIEVPFY